MRLQRLQYFIHLHTLCLAIERLSRLLDILVIQLWPRVIRYKDIPNFLWYPFSTFSLVLSSTVLMPMFSSSRSNAIILPKMKLYVALHIRSHGDYSSYNGCWWFPYWIISSSVRVLASLETLHLTFRTVS